MVRWLYMCTLRLRFTTALEFGEQGKGLGGQTDVSRTQHTQAQQRRMLDGALHTPQAHGPRGGGALGVTCGRGGRIHTHQQHAHRGHSCHRYHPMQRRHVTGRQHQRLAAVVCHLGPCMHHGGVSGARCTGTD
jgi:hypothetical protein